MIVCCRDGPRILDRRDHTIDGEHVADLDAVCQSLVQRDDPAAAGLETAERHAQDPCVDVGLSGACGT